MKGGAWNSDGVIILGGAGLLRVSAAGGIPLKITDLSRDRQETEHEWPTFLSDGKHFLYYANTAIKENRGVYVSSLDGNEGRLILSSAASATYVGPGLLLFLNDIPSNGFIGSLFAQPFDDRRLQLTGEPIRLAENVAITGGDHHAAFSVSANDTIAYRSAETEVDQLVWLDRSGKSVGGPLELSINPVAFELSPDGKRVAVDRDSNGKRDVWIVDLVRDGMARVTFAADTDGLPAWSADGTQLAFESARQGGGYDIYLKSADGGGEEQPLVQGPGNQWPEDFSRDGKYFLYFDTPGNAIIAGGLRALPLTGDHRDPITVASNPQFVARNGVFSPDGCWVAYETNESGRFEVVVQQFPKPASKFPVSTKGGTQPRWRADGKELYFIENNTLMASTVTATASAFSASTPIALFPLQVGRRGGKWQYTVSPDGRFLVNQLVEASNSRAIKVVVNSRAKP
jgi:hypothetical protein